MTDFGPLNELLALQRTRETATRRQVPSPMTARRPRGRHALAHRLHSLADRLDA